MTGAAKNSAEEPWADRWIWLLPIFGGVIGGVAAAAMTWERDRRAAIGLLVLGFVATAIFIAIIHTYGVPGERLTL